MPNKTEFLNVESAVLELLNCGAVLNSWGHTPATSSNFSIRLSNETCLVTASGKHKGRLITSDFVIVDLQGSIVEDLADGQRASAETLLHTQIYSLFPEVNAVLHSHSPASTLCSMQAEDAYVRISGYELLKAFPGVDTHDVEICVPVVENKQDMKSLSLDVENKVFTKELASSIKFPGYLIRGHGVYVWGNSSEQCLNYLEALEYLLNLIIQDKGNG